MTHLPDPWPVIGRLVLVFAALWGLALVVGVVLRCLARLPGRAGAGGYGSSKVSAIDAALAREVMRKDEEMRKTWKRTNQLT